MRTGTKVRLAFLLAIVALVAVPVGTMIASAHTQTFPSNLVLHYRSGSNTFDGHLGTAHICQDGRLVSIHEMTAGSHVVGTAVTDHSGHFGPIPNTAGTGEYFATVDEVDRGEYGRPVHCEAGVSNVAIVGTRRGP
jgi:hypothetical protein